MKSRDINHGIYMIPHGIKTIVMTTQSCLEWHMNEYRTCKDELFLKGLGKKGLLKRLEYLLPLEDKYFDDNPHLAVSSNQRWKNFCDDCVILATLSAYLNNSRVALIHPDSFNPSEGLNSKYEMPKKRPTFIEGIEIQQLN
jgi:hypothetical protein